MAAVRIPSVPPRPIVFALRFLAFFLLAGLLVRAGFHYAFSDGAAQVSANIVLKAYLLGLRYDLRLGLLFLLPVLVLAAVPRLTPFAPGYWRSRFWAAYLGTGVGAWILFHIFDFAHYAYLGTKLAASILNFLEDPKESAGMVWQTYPVIRLSLLWLATTAIITCLLNSELSRQRKAAVFDFSQRGRVLWAVAATMLLLLGVHGRFSQYPLRWSDAYFNPNPFVSALALNPVLNFYDTRKYRGGTYSLARVRDAYPRMAAYLGIKQPDQKSLDYSRVAYPKAGAIPGRPNIVIVLLESFSAYKSSLTGNPLNTTPFMVTLGQQSIVFDRFYTPHTGTARGVFATLTGLPDVDQRNTSSRNPAAVEQHSLVTALKGYETHYFIGGSTTWANVRGVIQKNIANLTIHEEGSFKSPVVDVWGISDKSLFLEANEVFREAKRPFFAIVQTAGNHRPYTIPESDTDFERRSVPDAELRKNGFFSLDEFNAFRYMDYAVRHFMDAARKESYFENTIFVFLGDHGIAAQGHDVGPHMPRAYQDLKLSAVHTPLIIHAPKFLRPARHQKVGSQIDVMPTILGLTSFSFRMQGLGRDLLDPALDDRRKVFTVYHDGVGEIGLLDDEWYFVKKANSRSGALHRLSSATPADDLSRSHPEIAGSFNQTLDDYFQTAQYLLTNNRQRPHPD